MGGLKSEEFGRKLPEVTPKECNDKTCISMVNGICLAGCEFEPDGDCVGYLEKIEAEY